LLDSLRGLTALSSTSLGPLPHYNVTHAGAAKAGIAAFTIISATELRQYGITVNAIAPARRPG